MPAEASDAPLILYDGDCGFCHKSVRFLLDHERGSRLRFAALNSAVGHEQLRRHGLPATFGNSVVLIEGGRAYLYSTAVVRAARYLRWPWRLGVLGGVLPRPVRDAMYQGVARVRGHLAGPVAACAVPKPEQRQRFIDSGCEE